MHIVSASFDILLRMLTSAWEVYLLLAPLFLFGLSAAGILYILISQAAVLRLMGKDGLSSVIAAAAFGMPLPICSCGVIPITATLRKKGASRPACMSFLITTPESGVDSILVTWGLMGPLMAIFRPFASFFSALIAGIGAIGLLRGPSSSQEMDHAGHHHHHHGHHHHHDHSHDLEQDAAVVGPRGLGRSIWAAMVRSWHRCISWTQLNDWNRPVLEAESGTERLAPEFSDVVPLNTIGKRIFSFAFIEMADDILLALVVGVLISGVVIVAFPENIVEHGLSGWKMYALMLIAGIPLYMCASASTPIGAAFIAKGFSPGAVLVFLLTGPATNSATIVVLLQQFGARFVSIYLASIAAGAVISGIALDMALIYFGWNIALDLEGGESGIVGVLEWGGAIALTALIVWRFWKGAAASGYHDMVGNIRSAVLSVAGLSDKERLLHLFSFRSRLTLVALPVLVLIYAGSGLTAVPVGHLGYGKVFGEVTKPGMDPGLHYVPPWPIGEVDIFPHTLVHRIVVGVEDVFEVENGQIGSASAGKRNDRWHSSLIPGPKKTVHAEFLTGDEHLMRALVSVHFQVTDPYVFNYTNANGMEAIAHAIETVVREYIATQRMDELLSKNRSEIEHFVTVDLINHLELAELGMHRTHKNGEHHRQLMQKVHSDGEHFNNFPIGIRLLSVNIVDVHPAPETMAAFRDVTDALQDKQTTILEAERSYTLVVPRAIGNAEIELRRSQAISERRKLQAEAEKTALVAKAAAIGRAPEVLTDLLWIETLERTLQGRQAFVLPDDADLQDLTLWHRSVPSRQQNGEHTAEREDRTEH